mmetsp:Transcript_20621/g.43175  ORF Transcript_20621/g.43175 Transcript_20621/m.43175 type:complete len:229 (+) Transcript_20621:310-996(+)
MNVRLPQVLRPVLVSRIAINVALVSSRLDRVVVVLASQQAVQVQFVFNVIVYVGNLEACLRIEFYALLPSRLGGEDKIIHKFRCKGKKPPKLIRRQVETKAGRNGNQSRRPRSPSQQCHLPHDASLRQNAKQRQLFLPCLLGHCIYITPNDYVQTCIVLPLFLNHLAGLKVLELHHSTQGFHLLIGQFVEYLDPLQSVGGPVGNVRHHDVPEGGEHFKELVKLFLRDA